MARPPAAATGRRARPGPYRRFATDPVLSGLFAIMVATSLLFLSGAGSLWLRMGLFWWVQVGADLTMATLSRRLGRSLASPAARRFWLMVSRGATVFAVGDGSKAALTAVNPAAGNEYAAWQAGYFLVGCLLIVWVMVTYPAPHESAKDRLRFWLDATTALVGSGVVAWCLLLGPALLAGADLPHLVESLISSAVVVMLGFALAKLTLSGDPPITALAATPVLIGGTLQICGDTLASGVDGAAQDNLLLVIRVLPALLIVAAPRIHHLQTGAGAPPRRPRRPYSLVPYVMVVLVFVLLCAEIGRGALSRGTVGALVGLGLITALVLVRQLTAFVENAELLRSLAYQASHDPLTGLANRTVFTDRLAATLPGRVAVVLVDLDGFKQVNDTLGHHAGDLMLVAVADRLRGSVRAGDTTARLGGDEFAMLLPGAEGPAVTAVVERFLEQLAEPVDIEGQPVRPRASVGAAVGSGADPEVLLRTADAAMYRVKHGGKGTYAVVENSAIPRRGGYPARSAG